MRINVHAHVFTFRTIMSSEAVRVFGQRLRDYGVPELIVKAVEKLFERLLDKPEVLDERQLLARLLNELRGVTGFDALVQKNLSRLPLNVVVTGGAIEDLGVDALRAALDQLTTAMDGGDEVGKRPFDIISTLRMAMRGTITEVADEILDQMDHEDALVALMMDVYASEEPERDRQNFERQIAGTREAALQRPGRVFPFFGVHPERPDHFEQMEKVVDEGSFLGIKLYPSLGYPVDHPKLIKVYEYCLEMDVPVLLHCGHGGFYRRQDYIDYCDPRHWEPVLRGALSDLRVCFAHFGGWQSLGRADGLQPGTWGSTILAYMRELPNVYTDLAYHTDQMKDPADESHYFTKLADFLQDPVLKRRILFGTDSWLLRMDMTDGVYWSYFRDKMSPGDFDAIASLAPRLFLGFPQATGGAMRANLQRHVDFLKDHRTEVGADPPLWLAAASAADFDGKRDPADWSQWSHAVRCVFRECSAWMTAGQKRGGYRANRTTMLKDLTYFRPRDPNFGDIVQGIALNLVGRAADDLHAGYQAGWNKNAAVERLKKVLREGEIRLVDVALLLDSIFAFEKALV